MATCIQPWRSDSMGMLASTERVPEIVPSGGSLYACSGRLCAKSLDPRTKNIDSGGCIAMALTGSSNGAGGENLE
jgi:hypothetical protein